MKTANAAICRKNKNDKRFPVSENLLTNQKILDILKQENVKATFFILGSNVDARKDVVKRMYEEGHYLANHGYSHTYSNIYSTSS